MFQTTPFDEKHFFESERNFVAVCSNCLNGETTYFEKNKASDIYQAVCANASMPYVSKMVVIDGIFYLDGGCSSKLAYKWPMRKGYKKIIVIRTRHKSFRYPLDNDHKLTMSFYKKYPEFASILKDSERRYNEDCDTLEALQK